MSIQLFTGDCREVLATLEPESVQTIVTSPPYWRLRRYTNDPREIGNEPTPAEYVAALVAVFAACRRVLRNDGTLWLNIGDAYANDTKWGGQSGGKNYTSAGGGCVGQRAKSSTGLPPKSLMGLPWRVAFALQDAGWVLRNEIIWMKPNGMPDSTTDRCTVVHEHIFLFAKQGQYYFDQDAIAEPSVKPYAPRVTRRYDAAANRFGNATTASRRMAGSDFGAGETRNPRSVWSIPTQGIPDEHYAPMPQSLAERCILAGSRPGDTVLDPFAGSGTTGRAALSLGRRAVLIDLAYQELQERRTNGVQVRMVDL